VTESAKLPQSSGFNNVPAAALRSGDQVRIASTVPCRYCGLIVAGALAWTTVLASEQEPGAKRKAAVRRTEGPILTVFTPVPEQFELSLTEIELESDPAFGGPESLSTPRATPQTSVLSTERGRSILRVDSASSAQDLERIGRALEAANPGTRANWVLYSPEIPPSAAGRVLLTREVGLILDENTDAGAALGDLGIARAVPGVVNGFVIEAGDPLTALRLVEKLRERPGVRTAYTLLKRQLLPR
jgi:hypothetical protein